MLAHAARLQTKVPGAILVGGTAAALESIAGWRTERRVRGTMVLGEADGIAAGLRNQRRAIPLETIDLKIGKGQMLRVPTVAEMLRVKAFLLIDRNTTRDYLDVAALSHHLGMEQSAAALERMNELYGDFSGEGGDMLTSLVTKLAAPDPYDLTDVDLAEYKGIIPPWHDWSAVETQCRNVAESILRAD